MQDNGLTPLLTGRGRRSGLPPYAIMTPVSESRQWRSSHTVGHVQTIQFSLFTDIFTLANQFKDQLCVIFPDSLSLTVDMPLGEAVLQMRWMNSNVIEDDSGKNMMVWHGQTDFEAIVTRPRQ